MLKLTDVIAFIDSYTATSLSLDEDTTDKFREVSTYLTNLQSRIVETVNAAEHLAADCDE